jgi:AraC family transcriptional regulator
MGSTPQISVRETLLKAGGTDLSCSGSTYDGMECVLSRFDERKLEQPELNEFLISFPRNVLQFQAQIGACKATYEWSDQVAFVIPPGAPATYWFSKPANRFHIRLGLDRIAQHVALAGKDPSQIDFRWGLAVKEPQLLALAHALEKELESGMPSGKLFGEGVREAVISHLLARHSNIDLKSPSGGLPKSALKRVLRRIEEGLGGNLSIEALAQEAGYSPWHFQRMFKSSTGLPVHRYVVERRVERARELLGKGIAFSEAARNVGFANSRQLKRWLP